MLQVHKVSRSTILILFFLLFAHSSYGLSCPPCTVEKEILQQAKEKLKTAKINIQKAQKDSETQQKRLASAERKFDDAQKKIGKCAE